jgi:hypothetical protein
MNEMRKKKCRDLNFMVWQNVTKHVERMREKSGNRVNTHDKGAFLKWVRQSPFNKYVTHWLESNTFNNLRLPFDHYWIVLRDYTVAARVFRISLGSFNSTREFAWTYSILHLRVFKSQSMVKFILNLQNSIHKNRVENKCVRPSLLSPQHA